jgi:hypothetical protein
VKFKMMKILGYIRCDVHGKQNVEIDTEPIKVYHVKDLGKTALCPKCIKRKRYQFFRDEIDEHNWKFFNPKIDT